MFEIVADIGAFSVPRDRLARKIAAQPSRRPDGWSCGIVTGFTQIPKVFVRVVA